MTDIAALRVLPPPCMPQEPEKPLRCMNGNASEGR